jgi:hypothetical protein
MIAGVTTGTELVSTLRTAAVQRGVSIEQFVRPLTGRKSPAAWLGDVGRARHPQATTIARASELLAGDQPGPPRAYARRPSAGQARTIDGPLPAHVDREPCFKCGTRGDIGCRHRPRYEEGRGHGL